MRDVWKSKADVKFTLEGLAAEDGERLVHLGIGNVERRQQADGIRARRAGTASRVPAASGDHECGRSCPPPWRRARDRGRCLTASPGRGFRSPRAAATRRPRCGCALPAGGRWPPDPLADFLQHRERGRAHQRIAAVGRTVRAGVHERTTSGAPPAPAAGRETRMPRSAPRHPCPSPRRCRPARVPAPACATPSLSPQRPKPACTSSNNNSRSCRRHSAATARRNSGVAVLTPPSPCIGSNRMAAVSGRTAVASAARSLNGR